MRLVIESREINPRGSDVCSDSRLRAVRAVSHRVRYVNTMEMTGKRLDQRVAARGIYLFHRFARVLADSRIWFRVAATLEYRNGVSNGVNRTVPGVYRNIRRARSSFAPATLAKLAIIVSGILDASANARNCPN